MLNESIGCANTSMMCPVKNAERMIILRLKKLLATNKAASKCLGLSSRTSICLSLRDMEFFRAAFSEVVIENKAVSEQDTSADKTTKIKINKNANTSPTCKAIKFSKI